MNKLILLMGIVVISFTSCSSYKYGGDSATEKSNLTMGVVKSKIIKGNTTQWQGSWL